MRLQRAKFTIIFDDLEKEFSVLNHNDFRATNILLEYNDERQPIEAKIIDYQLCCWTTSAFEKYSEELYNTYLETLNNTLTKLNCSYQYLKTKLKNDFNKMNSFNIVNFISLGAYIVKALIEQLPPLMQQDDYITVDRAIHIEEDNDDISKFFPNNDDIEEEKSDDGEPEELEPEILITTYTEAIASLSHLTKFALINGDAAAAKNQYFCKFHSKRKLFSVVVRMKQSRVNSLELFLFSSDKLILAEKIDVPWNISIVSVTIALWWLKRILVCKSLKKTRLYEIWRLNLLHILCPRNKKGVICPPVNKKQWEKALADVISEKLTFQKAVGFNAILVNYTPMFNAHIILEYAFMFVINVEFSKFEKEYWVNHFNGNREERRRSKQYILSYVDGFICRTFTVNLKQIEYIPVKCNMLTRTSNNKIEVEFNYEVLPQDNCTTTQVDKTSSFFEENTLSYLTENNCSSFVCRKTSPHVLKNEGNKREM
ncbi:hypothetical protein PGB90_007290 [Kerria lacca]